MWGTSQSAPTPRQSHWNTPWTERIASCSATTDSLWFLPSVSRMACRWVTPGTAANTAGTLFDGGIRLHRDGRPVHHHLGVSGFATHAVVDRRSAVVVGADDLDEARYRSLGRVGRRVEHRLPREEAPDRDPVEPAHEPPVLQHLDGVGPAHTVQLGVGRDDLGRDLGHGRACSGAGRQCLGSQALLRRCSNMSSTAALGAGRPNR